MYVPFGKNAIMLLLAVFCFVKSNGSHFTSTTGADGLRCQIDWVCR